MQSLSHTNAVCNAFSHFNFPCLYLSSLVHHECCDVVPFAGLHMLARMETSVRKTLSSVNLERRLAFWKSSALSRQTYLDIAFYSETESLQKVQIATKPRRQPRPWAMKHRGIQNLVLEQWSFSCFSCSWLSSASTMETFALATNKHPKKNRPSLKGART